MSIKQIDTHDGKVKGVAKRLDSGSEKMIYDILQKSQYSTPIPSTVRELVTNACDAQREKEIAIDILSGKAKEEDYYIRRDGDAYRSSNFDKEYYDFNWLDKTINHVEIQYIKNHGTGFCDTFKVIDFGVGIGPKRLEGMISLGYSTKRNTSEGFGAFGLGAKVALSTNVPYYTVDTVYNGKRFLIECSSYTTKSKVGKFDHAGTERKFILIDDEKFFYEDVTELNHTIVSFGVKRHNRTAFQEAIEEQLIYIPGVTLTKIDTEKNPPSKESSKIEVPTLYNSRSLVLSQDTVFSKPHIVIVKNSTDKAGINYGPVDFKELEMQEMFGSIGFKCPMRQTYRDDDGVEHVVQEGVSVTPSREKVIWDDPTKAFIQTVIKLAGTEATAIVENELSTETDFLEWINKCRETFSRKGHASVLGRLSNIIDLTSLSPKFGTSKFIRYTHFSKMFPGIVFEKITGYHGKKPKRTVVDSWGEIASLSNLYEKDANYSPAKDIYLCVTRGLGSFITVKPVYPEDEAEFNELNLFTEEEKEAAVAKTKEIWSYIKKSKALKSYAEIEVPKEAKEAIEKEIEDVEEKEVDNLSPSERRKLESREVGYTVRLDQSKVHSSVKAVRDEPWVLDKVEPKRIDLLYTTKELYYATSDDKERLFDVGRMIEGLMPTSLEVYGHNRNYMRKEPSMFGISSSIHYRNSKDQLINVNAFKDKPQFIQIRRDLVKKIPAASEMMHIDDFTLTRTPEDAYTTHPMLVHAFTARMIGEDWAIKFGKFMAHFKQVDKQMYDKYIKLENYMKPFRDRKGITQDTSLTKELDKLWQFQQFCMFHDEKEIKIRSMQDFVLCDVKGAIVVDMEFLNLYKELMDYAEGVSGLLNMLPDEVYTDSLAVVEIQRFLKASDRSNWKWDDPVNSVPSE